MRLGWLASSFAVAGLWGACGGADTPAGKPNLAALAAESATDPAAAPESAAPAAPTAPIGSYRASHTVMVVCDDPDWCEEEVSDSLEIRSTSDGGLDVSIELVQTNDHMCSFEGILRRKSEREWEWQAPEGDPECHLWLRWRADSLAVSSQGCREFCGARASLEAEFSYPPHGSRGAEDSPTE